METLGNDPFATKGIEYIVCLVFLGALPFYWRHLNQAARPGGERELLSGWFRLPERALFHPGHTWALASGPRRWRVGLDDYAQKVLGGAQSVALPEVGARLDHGSAWALDVDGRRFDLPTPIAGRVVARNEAAVRRPELINGDPYGAGWLLEIEARRFGSGMGSLLRGGRAKEWLARAEDALRLRMSPEVGAVLQDGGVPVSGIARALSEDEWEALARELLARG